MEYEGYDEKNLSGDKVVENFYGNNNSKEGNASTSVVQEFSETNSNNRNPEGFTEWDWNTPVTSNTMDNYFAEQEFDLNGLDPRELAQNGLGMPVAQNEETSGEGNEEQIPALKTGLTFNDEVNNKLNPDNQIEKDGKSNIQDNIEEETINSNRINTLPNELGKSSRSVAQNKIGENIINEVDKDNNINNIKNEEEELINKNSINILPDKSRKKKKKVTFAKEFVKKEPIFTSGTLDEDANEMKPSYKEGLNHIIKKDCGEEELSDFLSNGISTSWKYKEIICEDSRAITLCAVRSPIEKKYVDMVPKVGECYVYSYSQPSKKPSEESSEKSLEKTDVYVLNKSDYDLLKQKLKNEKVDIVKEGVNKKIAAEKQLYKDEYSQLQDKANILIRKYNNIVRAMKAKQLKTFPPEINKELINLKNKKNEYDNRIKEMEDGWSDFQKEVQGNKVFYTDIVANRYFIGTLCDCLATTQNNSLNISNAPQENIINNNSEEKQKKPLANKKTNNKINQQQNNDITEELIKPEKKVTKYPITRVTGMSEREPVLVSEVINGKFVLGADDERNFDANKDDLEQRKIIEKKGSGYTVSKENVRPLQEALEGLKTDNKKPNTNDIIPTKSNGKEKGNPIGEIATKLEKKEPAEFEKAKNLILAKNRVDDIDKLKEQYGDRVGIKKNSPPENIGNNLFEKKNTNTNEIIKTDTKQQEQVKQVAKNPTIQKELDKRAERRWSAGSIVATIIGGIFLVAGIATMVLGIGGLFSSLALASLSLGTTALMGISFGGMAGAIAGAFTQCLAIPEKSNTVSDFETVAEKYLDNQGKNSDSNDDVAKNLDGLFKNNTEGKDFFIKDITERKAFTYDEKELKNRINSFANSDKAKNDKDYQKSFVALLLAEHYDASDEIKSKLHGKYRYNHKKYCDSFPAAVDALISDSHNEKLSEAYKQLSKKAGIKNFDPSGKKENILGNCDTTSYRLKNLKKEDLDTARETFVTKEDKSIHGAGKEGFSHTNDDVAKNNPFPDYIPVGGGGTIFMDAFTQYEGLYCEIFGRNALNGDASLYGKICAEKNLLELYNTFINDNSSTNEDSFKLFERFRGSVNLTVDKLKSEAKKLEIFGEFFDKEFFDKYEEGIRLDMSERLKSAPTTYYARDVILLPLWYIMFNKTNEVKGMLQTDEGKALLRFLKKLQDVADLGINFASPKMF